MNIFVFSFFKVVCCRICDNGGLHSWSYLCYQSGLYIVVSLLNDDSIFSYTRRTSALCNSLLEELGQSFQTSLAFSVGPQYSTIQKLLLWYTSNASPTVVTSQNIIAQPNLGASGERVLWLDAYILTYVKFFYSENVSMKPE